MTPAEEKELREPLAALSGGAPVRFADPPAPTPEPRGDVARVDAALVALDLECFAAVEAAPNDLTVCAQALADWADRSLAELEHVDGQAYLARWNTLATVAFLLPVEPRPRDPRLPLVREAPSEADDEESDA
jgi:hypothetical protein